MKKISYEYEQELNLKVIIALARSSQHLRRQENKEIRDAGLTISQFGVLEVLYHKGDLRICDIIKKTLSTGGNMTVVINNLMKDGFISRYKDPEDQRAYVIQLTDKGRCLMDRLFPKHLEAINKAFEHLEVNEKETIINLLKKLSGIE